MKARSTVGWMALVVLVGIATSRGADSAPAASQPADRATLEKRFAEMLTDATLAGSYSLEGDEQVHNDRYTIVKAVKGGGDNWVITAKVQYKGLALPVDVTVPVVWAGDTPMIQLTNHAIPAMGTFTVRILFYNDRYAGSWSAGPTHQGMMWGKIEHGDAGKGGAFKPATKPGT